MSPGIGAMTGLVGSIEVGGTKSVCAVGSGPEDLRDVRRFPTGAPAATIATAIEYFLEQRQRHGDLKAVGIGSFGPLDLDRSSPTHGHVSSTPKPGWSGADVAGPIAAALGVPVTIDTDVNAAALGEWRWGAAQGLHTFVYLTIGTGIGGGAFVNDDLVHGLVHPEMGHLKIPRDPDRDPFPGRCPFHGDCWEGLAAGPAIAERWGRRAEALPPDHPAWELEAEYLALGLMTLVCVLSPQRIILGGGVMGQAHLLPMVRHRLVELLAGYVQAPAIIADQDMYVVAPALGDRAGILGGVALAQSGLARQR